MIDLKPFVLSEFWSCVVVPGFAWTLYIFCLVCLVVVLALFLVNVCVFLMDKAISESEKTKEGDKNE